LDNDLQIRINDLRFLKDRILNPREYSGQRWRFSIDADSIQDISDLKDIKSKLTLSQTDGSIDFKAVYLGDLSDANQRKIGKRSNFTVSENRLGNNINYMVNQDVTLEGLQLSIQLPKRMENVKLVSTHFDISTITTNISESGELRFVLTKDLNLSAGDILFSLESESIEWDESPLLLKDSKILESDYKTSELRVRKTSKSEVTISPNPTSSVFMVSGDEFVIEDIKNTSGLSIPFQVIDGLIEWNVAPGLYIIYLQVGDEKIVKKIIKI